MEKISTTTATPSWFPLKLSHEALQVYRSRNLIYAARSWDFPGYSTFKYWNCLRLNVSSFLNFVGLFKTSNFWHVSQWVKQWPLAICIVSFPRIFTKRSKRRTNQMTRIRKLWRPCSRFHALSFFFSNINFSHLSLTSQRVLFILPAWFRAVPVTMFSFISAYILVNFQNRNSLIR